MGVANLTTQSRNSRTEIDPVLPLRLEDLGYAADRHTLRSDIRQSPLLQWTEYHQWPDLHQAGSVHPRLDYLIVDVKFQPLWDLCLRDYLKKGARTVDAAPWGAQQVWQMETEFRAEYLLCWDDRIVYVELEEVPDDAQKAIIGEKLKP